MAKVILMDEIHVSVFAPHGLHPAAYRAIRRALDRTGFRAGLRRAVRDVVRWHPSLSKVRITLAR